ncbi:MAG: hypothetical protein IKM19_06430 [Firmicutes bacterium]|nr:hypothetical protein [Bacillota bacterium]
MKNTVLKNSDGRSVKFTFSRMPQNAEEIKELITEYPQTDKFNTAAFFMAALVRYVENAEDGLAMIDVLKGPELLSNPAKLFIKERFMDKKYLAKSYFEGSAPANNYTPAEPMTVTIYEDPVAPPEGYSYVHVKSSGGDNPRRLVMRMKSGHHYIWEYNGLLMGIRLPSEEDPWA